MVNKELKKLSRSELIDIIYQMKKNEQQLQEEIDSLKSALDDKRMRLSTAGSISEAAMSISGVFSAAQEAADLYLNEIASMKKDTEQKCEKMVEEASGMAEQILADAKTRYALLSARYQKVYRKYQKLRDAMRQLEELKKQEQAKDTRDDKET